MPAPGAAVPDLDAIEKSPEAQARDIELKVSDLPRAALTCASSARARTHACLLLLSSLHTPGHGVD